MDLKNLPWYAQFLVCIVIGAVLIAVFYFTWYSGVQSDIDVKRSENDKLQDKIRLALKGKERYEKIIEEIEKNKAILEDLKSILPEKQEWASIIKRIQNIATNARLKINTIFPRPTVQKEIYQEWPWDFSVTGNYHNLGLFFDQMSRLKKIFNVLAMNISPSTSLNPDNTINIGFTATTYLYKENPIQAAKPRPRAPRPDAGEGDKLQ
jgi:type IV pilus assembly protein PilO